MTPLQRDQPYGAAHLVERQMLLRDVGRRQDEVEQPLPRLRFVTISREVGSSGTEIAAELGRRLDWHVYDHEIVDSIARHENVRESLVEQLDEKTQSLVEDAVRRFLQMLEGKPLGSEEYHEGLVRTVAYFAARGSAILVGRGANFILAGMPGLHVRIVGSPEIRAARLAERWGVPPCEAAVRMARGDEERRLFVRHHFKRDVQDPRAYDLVFNTDRVSVVQVADAIVAAMKP